MVAPLAAAAALALTRGAIAEGAFVSRGLVSLALSESEAEAGGLTEITVPVASEAIRSIGYRVGDVITVEFKRGGKVTYEYPGTEELFLAFLSAPSKGRFFNDHFAETSMDRMTEAKERLRRPKWASLIIK